MKYCPLPFKQMHLDPGGTCRLCAWQDGIVGDLKTQSVDDVWHSEQSEKMRDCIRDNSFRYCRSTSCPYLENNSLEELSDEEFTKRTKTPETAKQFSVACDFVCNHSCPSCRDKIFKPSLEYNNVLDMELEKIAPYLDKAENIITDGNGDAFASPKIMKMLENLHPEDKNCSINIETNGSLFDAEHWEKIKHLGDYPFGVTVTPNSFEPSTFKYLSGGVDDLDKVLHNLGFMRELRHKGKINRFEVSIVIQDRNFWQLPAFAKRCIEEFDVDKVIVKPIYRWFFLSQDDYWMKDVLNPAHPYFNEYMEVLKDPILKNERVFFWGAKNIHPKRKHPAYIYKDHIRIARLLADDGAGEKVANQLHDMGINSAYIYGDLDLGDFLYRSLSDTNIDIKGFLARDVFNNERCHNRIKCICDFTPDDQDAVIVLDYRYTPQIIKDLTFAGYKGKISTIKEIIEKAFNIELSSDI